MPLSRREFLAAAGSAAVARAARQPNIIVIVAGDLGYGELGWQGNAEIPTPHIDSIARNGVRMTQGSSRRPCAARRAPG
jgi:arylsulfatase A-like enzyme